MTRGEYLYVALGTRGTVKVGRTRRPEDRQRALAKKFTEFGESIQRMAFARPLYEACFGERELIRALRRQGVPNRFGREWFAGGDFDATMQLAHSIAIATYPVQRAAVLALHERVQADLARERARNARRRERYRQRKALAA